MLLGVLRYTLPLAAVALTTVAIQKIPLGSPTRGIISLMFVLACAWLGGFGSALLLAPVLLLIARLQRDATERWAAMTRQELLAFAIISILCASLGLAGQYRRRLRAVTKQHAQKLKDQAQALSLAPIVFRDISGRVTEWSTGARQLLGWTADEVTGRSLHEVLKTQYPTPLAGIEAELDTTGQWKGEVICNHKDGTRLHLVAQWILYRDTEQRPIGIAEVLSDVTRLRSAEAQIREADRRKDEFLSMLAHELRNPLAPIRTGLDLIGLVKNEPVQVDATCEMMKRQMKQLVTLIDDLLDVSRISRGKFELKTSPVELADIVRSAVEAAHPAITAAGHELTITLPRFPVRLNADPHRLAQVLANLLDNAAKYTPTGGNIALTAECQQESLSLSVKDNGIGIPAEMLNQVFEIFTRIKQEHTISPSGLGVGLALVKSIVEMHGGGVQILSDGPGKGTEVRVNLHCERAAEACTETQAPHQKDEFIVPQRVLIVDDNRDAATVLGKVVERLGHEVQLAFDGREALEVAEKFSPHVVFLDLGMPVLDGYGAARALRKKPWGREMRLVALTGWGQLGDKLRTQEAGFDHHLVKPANSEEVKNIFFARGRRYGTAELTPGTAVALAGS